MNSCLYEGRVRHRRRKPKYHSFNFDLYMLCLDLNEIDEVFRGRWLWSCHRPAFARFKSSDHLKAFDTSLPLRERVLTVLERKNLADNVGSIRLLTQFRYLGFEMNPVSFFYCYDRSDQHVVAVIAEVNNTPWGEQHVYVIGNSTAADRNSKTIVADHVDKDFHVSPFMSLDMFYRMVFTPLGEQIGVKIENFQNPLDCEPESSERIFNVAMSLKQKPINSWNLNRVLISYPLISFKIFAGIYWHALRLYLKRVPFFAHPDRQQHETSSLSSAVSQTSKPQSLQTTR